MHTFDKQHAFNDVFYNGNRTKKKITRSRNRPKMDSQKICQE